ncbi:MAG: hypothetical protein A2937_01770 [Candidatus Yonathbacteria bacterium RIFCSPLOWO2_01_FULL_47_33b]|uniref:Uncharacterized protein n=1 Tax=Candidatus Yonathbacteria bacterium RIFCSPLOWO2_01_FULL_47_33b TaxID=1802727 RepID=A0A1G2SGR0_9BACT|nr:MAG: hypothetical protein A2937_01770 [Candidatus Yonathbacteria bacterium RIFCSPLOWO2_01_FULL_47_33b]
MRSKVLSNMVMPALTLIVLGFFVTSMKSTFALPTVEKSVKTGDCVRATDSRGKRMSCEKAKKGTYHMMWVS